MRVLLIQATEINKVNPEIVYPLGLMSLAATLKPHGHDVRIVDMRLEDENIESTITSYRPDVIGISGLTQNARLIQSTAKTARRIAPKTLIALGGPHATAYRDRVLDETGADVVVPGEGDITFPELLAAYDKGVGFDDVAGVLYRKNGEVCETEPRPMIEDLDTLPFPAWELVDIDRYSNDKRFFDLRQERRFMAVFSSRGCPYRCIFCHQVMGKCFRSRSPANVLKELRYLNEHYGIREIEFWDDVFNLDRERAMAIFRGIIDSPMNLNISFRSGLRGDRLDSEFISTMRKAGTYHIAYAFEAGTERMQKLMRKNLNIPLVLEAISESVDLGIFTRGFFMMGFPSERREEIQATIDLASHSKLHLASFFIVNAFKGTEVYRLAQKMGKAVDLEYDNYDFNAMKHSLCDVPAPELARMQRAAYLKFFTSPDRLWRIARDLPNKKYAPQHMKQLLRRVRLSK